MIFFLFLKYIFRTTTHMLGRMSDEKLLEKADVRPYGFPPALWIALGYGETIITQEE